MNTEPTTTQQPEQQDAEPVAGETYSQRIWEEFRSHPENMLGLYLMLFFFMIALCAPLFTSSYPFYWSTEDQTLYPWFTKFFSARLVDQFYNMSLLSLLLTGMLSPGFIYLYRAKSSVCSTENGRRVMWGVMAGLWVMSWVFVGNTYMDVLAVLDVVEAVLSFVGISVWDLSSWSLSVPLPGTLLYGIAAAGAFFAWHRFDWSTWWRSNFVYWSGTVFLLFLFAGLLTFPDNFITVQTGTLVSDYPERYDRAETGEVTAVFPLNPRLYKQQNIYSQQYVPFSYPLTGEFVEIMRAEKQKELLTLYARAQRPQLVSQIQSVEARDVQTVVDLLQSRAGREQLEEKERSRIKSLTGLSPDQVQSIVRGLPDQDDPDETLQTLIESDPEVKAVYEDHPPRYLGLSKEAFTGTDRYKKYQRNNPIRTHMYFLGTDARGNDMFTWAMYGSRISLSVGFVATFISLLIGIILGAIAGYFGGWVDLGISRLLELVMMFPQIFLIIILLSMVENKQMFIFYIMVLIGLLSWPGTCRLIRGTSLEAREEEYTMAARSLGAGNLRIIFKHVLPNAIYPIFVSAPFAIAGGVILEGGLSLIGFGAQQYPSWGRMLEYARQNSAFYHDPHLIIIPIMFLFFAVLGYILIGFGLRDAVDPKMKAN